MHGGKFWILASTASLGLIVALVVIARTVSRSPLDQWHPARSGSLNVVEKRGDPTRPRLRIQLEVPAATPSEAALIPESTPDRARRLAAQTFELEVPVDREKWEGVAVGQRIRGMYHINVARTHVFVTDLYLDSLQSPGPQTVP